MSALKTPAASGAATHAQASLRSAGQAWQRLKQNKAAFVSFFIIIIITLLAILSPWIALYPYQLQNLMRIFEPPSAAHWLGTDSLGRDLLSRLLYGARVSITVAFLSTVTIAVIGTIWGAVAGYFGGWVDQVMMRFVDILYSLPYMFFVIILMMFFGRDLLTLFIAIGSISWLTMSRIVRGQVMSLKNKDFIMAARALGTPDIFIIIRHILPNVLGTIAVYATIMVPRMIILEAFLSFLGMGVQEPLSSWGSLCNDGVTALYAAPWLILWPGAMMAVTLLSFNFLGDGLRDALDPHAGGGS